MTPHNVLNLWSPIYDPSAWGTWALECPSICIPITSPTETYGLSLTVFSYLAGTKSVSARPSVRPGYDANTALEAVASSSGKNAERQAINYFD